MRENLSAAVLYALDTARERIAGANVVALTGAGISTDSGIPDYRGEGRVARHPMTFDSFMGSESARIRYWARSFVGWSRINDALPNNGHIALAEAEKHGRVTGIITQNVDRLHQEAGSKNVVDLHGTLSAVRCMACDFRFSRIEMDGLLQALNPDIRKDDSFEFTPDGDAEVEAAANFVVPPCPGCGGILKPDVVFFGESVPTKRVELCMSLVDQAQVLLVAGTSLAVNSGLRFVRHAHKSGKDIVIVNIGPTKADELANAKIEASTSLALPLLLT